MTTINEIRSDYDVVVVGARCAGAATAMLLARAGLSVLAIDRAAYATDTLSTLALMRAGVLQLHRWGILDDICDAGTPPIRTTTFHYGDDAIEIAIKPRYGVDALYAPRRTLLDARLADAASRAGATVVHGPRVTTLLRGADGRVAGIGLQGRSGAMREVRADLVIGADGIDSTVARFAGAREYRIGLETSGVIYSFWRDVPFEGYHWWYREGISAGTIPTNDGLTCIFASAAATRFMDEWRHDMPAAYVAALAEVSPALQAGLSFAAHATPLHGFAGHVGFLRESHGPGWALVGDAGYFKDPITAHGITDALRDAELLSRAVVKGTDAALADYQQERDALVLPLFEVTDEIASYAWSLPRLRDLHKDLSHEMQREVRYILDATATQALA